MVTLKDIAKILGVSTSTVSRALKNHPRIGLDTKTKVQKLALELDFQPNTVAINLKNKQTKTIGVIVPDLSISHFAMILQGIDTIAFQQGYHTLVSCSNESLEKEIELCHRMVKANVDGILIAPSKETANTKHIRQIEKRGVKILLFARELEHNIGVYTHDKLGAKAAAEYLISKNYKNIAHIAGPWHLQNTHDRVTGFYEAMKTKELKIYSQSIVHSDLSKEQNIDAFNKIAHHLPDTQAIFCFNDNIAADINDLAYNKGIELIGYSNQEITDYTFPKINTVDQFPEQLGRRSMHLLLEWIQSRMPPSQTIWIEPELVIKKQ